MGRTPKEGVFLYASIIEIVRASTDADAKALVIAVADYVMKGIEPTFDSSTPLSFVWLAIKPNLDVIRTNKANGRLGGAPKGNRNNRFCTTEVQPKNNRIQADKDKDKDKDKETKAKKAVPSLDEVKAYIAEKGYNLDAEEFFYYYEANGWKVGKNPMKSWRAAVSTWAAKRKNETPSRTSTEQISFRRL